MGITVTIIFIVTQIDGVADWLTNNQYDGVLIGTKSCFNIGHTSLLYYWLEYINNI